MRIVHVNFDALAAGGASIAMIRIHRALLAAGVDSVIVCRCFAQEPHSILFNSTWLQKQIFRCLSLVLRGGQKLFFGRIVSINLLHTGVADLVNSLHPDIVQLHWLQNDAVAIEEIAKTKAPLVWTLHDQWPMAGSDACPVNDWYQVGYPPEAPWLDRWMWQRKCRLVSRLHKHLYPVGASTWICQAARQSIVFKQCRVFQVPLPLSPDFCKDQELLSRTPNKRFTILFGSTSGIASANKGFDRLLNALDLLPESERAILCIKVFGASNQDSQRHGVPIEFLGHLSGGALADAYRQADVFAFPSRRETFGQTKLEALACGTPVVAFDETACAEGIEHRVTGWIAPADDIGSFAEGLRWAMELWRSGKRIDGTKIRDAYAPEQIAKRWQQVYQEILEDNVR